MPTPEEVVCDERTHRYGMVRVETGDQPVSCACGGVTVSLREGRLQFSMTFEAMKAGGAVEMRSVNNRPSYSLAWGGQPGLPAEETCPGGC